MHMLPRVAVLLVFGLLAWPSESWACSCAMQPDVRESLKTARKEAAVIFHGRVDDIQEDFGKDFEGPRTGQVTFTVLETFKGKAAPQRFLRLFEGCEYYFDKGVEYLVYANGNEQKGLTASLCSRTQPAQGASVEMESLRSGTLPRRPVAMRRQHVSCTRCDVEAVAQTLVCGDKTPCEPSEGKTSEDALKEGRPFWERAVGYKTQEERALFGVGQDGRAFQLVQRPDFGAKEACEQRVLQRRCERLSLNPAGHGARVTCTGPSEEEALCEEKATRRVSWGPVEAPPRGTCHWIWADAPLCEWDSETVPLKPGAPTRPGLVCTTGPRGNMFPCQVVPDAAATPPAENSP
ncbi:hypothetical protein ACN28E_51405 [Archangium lansingense]|uniref:hypothetical protein n=1 Tax=Archangium lansingense TaxID=2995310 RepID=UPI003B7EE776